MAHDSTMVMIASVSPAPLLLEAPSSNTIAAMLASAPSCVTIRIRMRPSSCRMALGLMCSWPQRDIMA